MNCKHVCVGFCGHQFSAPLGKCQGAQLVDCMVNGKSTCNFVRHC